MEEKTEEKRERLNEAAHELFLQNGYKDTNISQIAQKAGMAVGSFYKYYASKEEIFLDVHIRENETMRKQLIEEIDWDGDAERVIEQLFAYSFNNVMSNKILAEWNKPFISDKLHEYYASETGRENNSFHRFLRETFANRLKRKNLDTATIGKILKVLDFIYYVDCHIASNDFEAYGETLQTFVLYFVKGILAE